jgi:hypothetical protein
MSFNLYFQIANLNKIIQKINNLAIRKTIKAIFKIKNKLTILIDLINL